MQKNKNLPQLSVITGGSSGIGLAIAKKFQSAGIEVVIADKHNPKEELKNIRFKTCDVGSRMDIELLSQWIHNETEGPDVLVVNAGRGVREKLCEGDPEKWQKIIDTNVMGALRTIRAFVPAMLEKKKGHIIFISSVAANQPHPYGGVYSASKSALEVIAETLRLETLPHLSVTVINPGITDTNFFENQVSGNGNAEDLGLGTITPEEIADDVFYAISKKPGTTINKIVTRPIAQEF